VTPGTFAQHLAHRRVIDEPALLPDVDVRLRPEDAIAHLPLQPRHERQAMTSADTPTATPRVEMSEMSEMNACFRFASR
jgi:hypothetical protein